MTIYKGFLAAICLVVGLHANAVEYKGVKMAESIDVGGKKLVFNGYGLREVEKFGFMVNVYVGALYLPAKSQDRTAILNDENVRQLIMTFVRPVDKEPLVDGFRTAYYASCIVECDKKDAQFPEFSKAITNVRKDDQIKLTFYKDKMEVEVVGANPNKSTIMNVATAKNVLNMYIHSKVPKKLGEGLLGINLPK